MKTKTAILICACAALTALSCAERQTAAEDDVLPERIVSGPCGIVGQQIGASPTSGSPSRSTDAALPTAA